MILADKIVSLRKKAGWSQEDLAEKLGVTRQSVSKWEGAQSVPDMDKVVMMSRLFGVSTDFLLKDELEEETPCAAAQDDDTPLRRVSLTQASAYLALRKAAAPKIAVATALCITSPVTLILLAGMSEVQRFHISVPHLRKCRRGHRAVRAAGSGGAGREHLSAGRCRSQGVPVSGGGTL